MNKLQRYLGQILFHSTFGITLLTTAAMLLILWFLLMGTHPSVRVVADSSDDPPSPAAALATRVKPSDRYAANRGDVDAARAPKCVARLARTCDCRWAKNTEALREGAPLRAGQTLRVTTGLAEIAFACGAKAILEGPVVLEIESTKTAVLHSGKLTANVPDDLEGFMIRTPVVEIVALPADPTAAKAKTAPKAKPSAGKSDSEAGVVLKAGEHARIEAPAKVSGDKTQPPAGTPQAKS